ncbi:beta-phosphoglucomutase [Tichowtungia aerotolerans]|uniref:Beta-phosphoglucomutase n=1 Tax=Tichowtungia aerotolerans TaxID=2697043 RepID=A0A6P1MCE4_9BACT|nr:beta-phosphoglucomutase [Tichowtungia aerotolerans]QHI68755.1 beta-phosphoglucomutase [Tichowtungia aerotolerans]
MQHQIRAVLFDLDGVVVFTDKYHYLGWKKLADEKGWAFDEEVNHGCRGVPRLASLQVILDHNKVDLPQDEKERLADIKNEYYKELLKQINEDDIYPGVVPFLEKLKEEGVRMAICSSSKNAMPVLDALGLAKYFDAVITGNDIENPKPDPEIFLKGAAAVNMHPFHCLVFEDAESGVDAAHAAHMKCIGVGEPQRLPNAHECVTDYAQIDIQALLDAGRVKTIPKEPWNVTETDLKKNRFHYWETAFALSNGVFGVRGTFEESDPGYDEYPATLVNGICGYEPYQHIWKMPGYPEDRHAILNMADWANVDLSVDGETFSIATAKMSSHRRSLDLKRGILEREFVWETTSGKTVLVKTERLVSMVRRQIGALRYAVTAPDGCEVSLRSRTRLVVPSAVMPGEQVRVTKMDESFALQELTTADDRVAVAQAYSLDGDKSCDGTDWLFVCNASGKITLDKFFAVASTMDGDGFEALAQDELEAAREVGFDKLCAEQSAFWAQYWNDGDIEIDGDLQDQQGVRFSLFHLRQGNPERDNRSISANGLTGDGYSGHVFWDTEMYMLPPYIYTQPETVRPLLEYRYSILDKARERAVQMQGKGALFSWNSVKGEECGHVHEASTAEYHLLSDIAYAIELYDRMTGDDKFTLGKGAEILFEMCRFLEDRGCYVDGKGFCLNVVCGPDEYGCGVNNNAYTNVMARAMFNYSVAVYDRVVAAGVVPIVSAEEVAAWKKAADEMFVPYDEKTGLTPQDDSFLDMDPVDMDLIPKNTDIRPMVHPLNLWRMQVVKQADVVLLMYVHGELFTKEQKEKNYLYYEPKTNHGSSLSPCMHSILASELGYKEDAYRFFRQTALMDINDFKNNTGGGVHSACLGGCWMTVVNGFAGMRDYPDGLQFNPVLPEAWTRYSFPIVYKGSRFRVTVTADGADFKLESGEPLQIKVNGEDVRVS